MTKYSIVVPIYNSEKSLVELYNRIKNVFENTIKSDFELILVDDFSKDSSFAIMTQLHNQDNRIIAIQLSKNCGQHPAILCGMKYASGNYIVTMDDDLQHPPEEIPKLIKAIESSNDYDIIIGRYESKKHNLIRNWGTKLSGYVSYRCYGKPRDLELTSFRIMKRDVVKALLSLNVDSPRIGNLLLQINGRIGNTLVEHDERKYGKSGYTFKRLIKDLFNNLLSNSGFPLILVRNIGIGSLGISVLLGFIILIRYFVKGTSIIGWTSLVLLFLFYGGLILFALGITGDYLMRIMNESKKMPNYYIREVLSKENIE